MNQTYWARPGASSNSGGRWRKRIQRYSTNPRNTAEATYIRPSVISTTRHWSRPGNFHLGKPKVAYPTEHRRNGVKRRAAAAHVEEAQARERQHRETADKDKIGDSIHEVKRAPRGRRFQIAVQRRSHALNPAGRRDSNRLSTILR